MWKFLILCVLMAATNQPTEAASSYRKRYVGSSAGGYASAGGYGGYGGVGGYAGSYDDGDYYGTGFGYSPDFGPGFIDPFLFHQQLTAQILSQHAAQNSYIQQQAAQQSNAARRQGLYKQYKNHRYAPHFAAASGSIGPGGYYQTAYISPENPGSPNIVNRFGASSPGGYKGVSVSSFSNSADVNGRRQNYRGAQTTVNDNGKITTYSTHS